MSSFRFCPLLKVEIKWGKQHIDYTMFLHKGKYLIKIDEIKPFENHSKLLEPFLKIILYHF